MLIFGMVEPKIRINNNGNIEDVGPEKVEGTPLKILTLKTKSLPVEPLQDSELWF